MAYLRLWREFARNSSQFDLSELDRADLAAVFLLLKNAGAAALDDTQLTDVCVGVLGGFGRDVVEMSNGEGYLHGGCLVAGNV